MTSSSEDEVEPVIPLIVKQGQIVVNSGWVVRQGEGFCVWEFDLKSKYPDCYVIYNWTDEDQDGDKEGNISICLVKGPDTLRSDDTTAMPTIIKATTPDGERWEIIPDWARYTVRVCFYRSMDEDTRSRLPFIDMEETS